MSYLDENDLMQLRADANGLLTETCVIRSPGTPQPDGAGGWTDGTPTDSGPYACERRMPSPGREMEQASILQLVSPWIIVLPAGTNVNGDDQIIIGSDIYEVKGVIQGGTREIVRRVLAVEVR